MKPILYLSFTTAATAFLLAGCGGHEEAANPADLPTAEVRTTVAESAVHEVHQWLPGTVHPSDRAVVAARLMGTVEEVAFEIGQHVAEGDFLVGLRADEVDARVAQARAALAQVERNLARERSLLERKATTPETVRTLEDELEKARAALAEAETMLSYTRVTAPFSGIVTSKEIRRGDLARPGMPLLTLEGAGDFEVHVQVPDSLSGMERGALLAIELNGRRSSAKLTEWSPAADPASRTRLAKLSLPESTGARSGQYVRVYWPAGKTESVWIPDAALSPFGQLERVYVFDGQAVHLRLVKSGLREEGRTQIRSGLRAGERIVLDPAPTLRDGQPATEKAS